MAALSVLTDPILLRQVVGFMRGIPFLLLDLERSLEKDEWSAYHGDATLLTRFAIQRDDRRVLQMLQSVHCAVEIQLVSEKLHFDDVLLWAVRIGNLNTLTWLHDTFPGLRASAQLVDVAIKAGRVDLLNFLEVNYSQDFSRSDVSSCALAFAPRTKWLEVAEWLHTHDYRNCFSSYVFERVVECGDVELLRFLHTSRPASFPGHMMYLAAMTGNLEAVRTLRPDPRNTRSMDTAAQNGHLEVVKFLHEVRREACTVFAMDSAACNGFLDVVKYLHENRTEGCTKDALNGAAQFGHLHTVEFLVENRSEGSLQEALVRAERKNQQHIAGYLRDRLQLPPNAAASTTEGGA